MMDAEITYGLLGMAARTIEPHVVVLGVVVLGQGRQQIVEEDVRVVTTSNAACSAGWTPADCTARFTAEP